jgi:hypothetical protein
MTIVIPKGWPAYAFFPEWATVAFLFAALIVTMIISKFGRII